MAPFEEPLRCLAVSVGRFGEDQPNDISALFHDLEPRPIRGETKPCWASLCQFADVGFTPLPLPRRSNPFAFGSRLLVSAKHDDEASEEAKPSVLPHALARELLSISQSDQCDASVDQPNEWGQSIKRRLTVKPVEALADQRVRQRDSTILNTTDELSEPTPRQMVPRECADGLVDDGLDDEETMLVRIPLGRLKLAPKAVAPCLRFTRPAHIDGGRNRWLDRSGDHARTMTIDHGSSRLWPPAAAISSARLALS